MPKRMCKICGKQLSDWNKFDICFCHQPGMVVFVRIPVTGCTSYTPLQDPVAIQPGDPEYDDLAFEKLVAGVITMDED